MQALLAQSLLDPELLMDWLVSLNARGMDKFVRACIADKRHARLLVRVVQQHPHHLRLWMEEVRGEVVGGWKALLPLMLAPTEGRLWERHGLSVLPEIAKAYGTRREAFASCLQDLVPGAWCLVCLLAGLDE